MSADFPVHTLLRIAGPEALVSDAALPEWIGNSLHDAPWVIVRRARTSDGFMPVGIRGKARQQRFAAWLAVDRVQERLLPRELADRRVHINHTRVAAIPALQVLDEVMRIAGALGLRQSLGIGGSVGFELASGCPTATAESDLDLMLHLDTPLAASRGRALLASLQALPVRIDILMELPCGAIALAEFLGAEPSLLLRSIDGPRLLRRLEFSMRPASR